MRGRSSRSGRRTEAVCLCLAMAVSVILSGPAYADERADGVSVSGFFGGCRDPGRMGAASPSDAEHEEDDRISARQMRGEFLEALSEYLEEARDCEAKITGENREAIPDSRFFVTDQRSNDQRVISIASQAAAGERTFYVIGRNFMPNGTAIARWYGGEAVYANLLEASVSVGQDVYYVARMGMEHHTRPENCVHRWELQTEHLASCLGKGENRYLCGRCGEERTVARLPAGHEDLNGDSVCDRCEERAFPQKTGDRIQVALGQQEMTFTCIDESYGEGMLYLSDQVLPLEFFGGYGEAAYERSLVYRYFRDGFQNGCSVKHGILGIQAAENGETAYAMSLSEEEYERYREVITGGGFLLRDSRHGTVLGVDHDGALSWQNAENTDYGIRPAMVLETPDEGTPDRIHWDTGDLLLQEMDGKEYLFRCIDQNYSDDIGHHRQAALFLGDFVIPADYGSDYRLEETEDGGHAYVFRPGPVVSFGDSNDYKDSRVRAWLGQMAESLFQAEPISIGVDDAYMGSTGPGERSSFDAVSLRPYRIGDQKLEEQLFILSVDEAVKYRDVLWKFEGSRMENPESQVSAFSKGYWLRTPMGNSSYYDTDSVYVVDLVNGNIHPAKIRPEEQTGDGETDVTSVYGVRPAFAIPQD